MIRIITLLAAAALSTAAVVDDTTHMMDHHPRLSPEDATVSRSAAEGFCRLEDALAAGYEPLFDCTDAGAGGAMGQHYISKAYASDGSWKSLSRTC